MKFIEICMQIPEEFINEVQFTLKNVVYNEIDKKHRIAAAETIAESTKIAIQTDINEFRQKNNLEP